ncbi:isochorismatase family protein [Zooshikella ganghwensis]|nr:isochorismatase family protein [Zooshikella ganghwensis]
MYLDKSMNLGNKQFVASFDVDAQQTFTPLCSDELPVPDGHTIVEELNAQAQLAGWRIGSKDAHSPHAIWVADEHHPPLQPVEGKHVDVRWPVHAVPGSKGFSLLPGLPEPAEYDFFVWKGIELDMHPYGACFHDLSNKLSTGVIEFLHFRQIQWIVLGGLALDYCVKTTALQLRSAGFKVIVNLAATRGLAPESAAHAKAEMGNAGVLFIARSSDLKIVS